MEIIKSMKNKRGTDLRIKIKKLKDKFINDLSELENEIVQSYENAPKDDKFNINQLYIAIREVDAIKQIICSFDIVKEKKAVACSIITGIFTEKETEIFKLLIKGHTAQYIADKLFISKRTVETHFKNMLIKISENKMFADIIKNSKQFKEFENKNGDAILRKPEKLLKFLYEIFSS